MNIYTHYQSYRKKPYIARWYEGPSSAKASDGKRQQRNRFFASAEARDEFIEDFKKTTQRADPPKEFSLAMACARVPEGAICLISALSFHEIGTQNPHKVWMAIGPKAWKPNLEYPALRVMRFSGNSLTEGVMETGDPFGIRVFNPAKTVADCFKFRNKIGLDVAIEALREGWRDRRFTIEELDRYAKICRVEKIMTPYLEAIR